jgi:uncharacterized membrane protein YciS (DUF1049 family)
MQTAGDIHPISRFTLVSLSIHFISYVLGEEIFQKIIRKYLILQQFSFLFSSLLSSGFFSATLLLLGAYSKHQLHLLAESHIQICRQPSPASLVISSIE